MIEKKSKNKFLLTTSLFSLMMGMLSLNAMADTVEHGSEHIETTIKYLNYEVNKELPQTDNSKAIFKSNINQSFREKATNENFCFKGPDGRCINCKSTDGNRCNEQSSKTELGYTVGDNTKILETAGYVVGDKSVISDEGSNGYENTFFRYWKSDAESQQSDIAPKEADPQFSASYPKLCYTGFSTPNSLTKNGDGKYKDSLIRLVENGGDKHSSNKLKYSGPSGSQEINIPVRDADQNLIPSVIRDSTGVEIFTGGSNSNVINNLSCKMGKNCELVKDGNCLKVKYKPNLTNYTVSQIDKQKKKGYDFATGTSGIGITNCNSSTYDSCANTQVKSFTNNTSGIPYRKSKYVSIDITGNKDLIEIPGQSCYKCMNVASGPTDTSCEYILREVWEASGKNCESTVRNMVLNPRANTGKDYLPADMNSSPNCSSCLCKIEGLLKGAPYYCG